MTVGVRITIATSVLLALTLGAYAALDLRAAASQRRDDLEHDTREVAVAIRATIEARGVATVLTNADDFAEEISRAGSWRVAILPRAMVTDPTTPEREAQIQRLRDFIEVRLPELSAESHDVLIYALPLRVPAMHRPEGYEVAGSLEIARSTARLGRATRADLRRTLPLLAIILGLTILAVGVLTHNLISRRIEKLLAGIDEVAKGDLSSVLLSERDDEIGTLAARFTEMTGSLRESRHETQRHNQAKLALEQRLSRTEKMATIGQIAAEIAHEVGTPLNVISGRAKSLGRKAGNREAVEKHSRIIAEQTDRIARIIQRLLDYTRRTVGSTGEQQTVSMNEITLATMEFLEGQFSSAQVKTTLRRCEGLPRVQGEPDRLQQVLLNVIINSIQAMPGGGTLEVETSLVTRRRPGLEATPEQAYILVEVTDTGVGVPEEKRKMIFDPFYTSKEGAGGTGLGLAVSHGIVKEHDGWMDIDTPEPDATTKNSGTDATRPGTVVRIYLPAENSDQRKDEA